jgi:hypothetical protein
MDSEPKNERRLKRGGGRAYHSRLESFVDFIRDQRQQRRTWREIALRLSTEKDCPITLQGLHLFYRRYRKRQARPHWEDGQPPLVGAPARPNGPASRPEPSKPMVAAVPSERPFRKPNPDSLNLNDPTV